MIKRRSVRIKVFQALYGFEHSDVPSLPPFRKTLDERICSVTDIYLYNLLMLREIVELVQKAVEVREARLLKTTQLPPVNTKWLSNVFYKLLETDETFNDEVSQRKLADILDEVLIRNWYREFTASEAYREYLESPEAFNVKVDLQLMRHLYRDFLLDREDFHLHLQEHWSNWIDDAGFISSSVTQTIDKSKHELVLAHHRANFPDKLDELRTFGSELLKATINGKEQHLQLISGKLKNWDIERLASTDILILRMALAELLTFPTIPTKVTINEYIDIAKEYSTPRSKDFINGILDNLVRELTDKGMILKEGRGLKES